jgi:hypothetical protein
MLSVKEGESVNFAADYELRLNVSAAASFSKNICFIDIC